MEITVLLENSKKDERFRCNHRLSLYVEAGGKMILLDMGRDDSFIYNAKLLDVDIKAVDFAVVSHFHYDHTGGLKAFLELNKEAKVFIEKEAFADYYVSRDGRMEPFGMDKAQFDMDRFIFVDEEYKVSDKIKIISKLGYTFNNPLNEKFYKKVGDKFIKDDFSHEAALVIKEGESNVLLSGCFHSGVVNSIEKASLTSGKITHAVGGFHLSGSGYGQVTPEYLDELAFFLSQNKIISYTGHCTGPEYYDALKNILKHQVFPIFTGSQYKI